MTHIERDSKLSRPARKGKKRIYTHLNEGAAIELAVLAKREKTSVDAILKEAINLLLEERKADFRVL